VKRDLSKGYFFYFPHDCALCRVLGHCLHHDNDDSDHISYVPKKWGTLLEVSPLNALPHLEPNSLVVFHHIRLLI